jgi:hypothetical protein
MSGIIDSHLLLSMYVTDGRKMLLAEPGLRRMTVDDIRVNLPEQCWEISTRKIRRTRCHGLNVQVVQNNIPFNGRLIDFSAVSFRVELAAIDPQSFSWISSGEMVHVVFSNGSEILFSGKCSIIKEGRGDRVRHYVLEPSSNQMSLYEPKEFRSARQELVPQPNIVFTHPLTGKMTTISVLDLSGSGFSVEEEFENAVLLPGMIIPSLEIWFANSLSFPCRAQVVYRTHVRDDHEIVRMRFGFVILDMDINSHTEMSTILHQANNRNSYFCNRVDMDELWNFFFETGFVYPKKYTCIRNRKDDIKKTYERLYTQSPTIAKHCIYQNNGTILGHMSMLRFYNNSWMIHHHAARKSAMVKAGLAVLQQIGRLTFDLHRINSGHMRYLFCYFRPENSFPAYVFGGAAANMNNVRACSIDSFAYCHYRGVVADGLLSPQWTIEECAAGDYRSLSDCYMNKSGGLMLDALDMGEGGADSTALADEFHSYGFIMERRHLAFKKNGETAAVMIVNSTDFALNLSDLTNALSIFVVRPDLFSERTMAELVGTLYARFGKKDLPLMIYPVDMGRQADFVFDKTYNLWILKTEYSDHYFRIINELLNIAAN